MIELRPAYMTLTAEGLTAQQAADAVKVLRAAGIETVTITQEVIAAEVPDTQQLAPEGAGVTFLGHPIEWFSHPHWEHDLAPCDYVFARGNGKPCALPAFHEVPPLAIEHADADEFDVSRDDATDWKLGAREQLPSLGLEECQEAGDDDQRRRCVLPDGHMDHASMLHTDSAAGPDGDDSYVWF